MAKVLRFEVLEDNGGGLHLVVFNKNGKATYFHSDYEFCKGQLTEDLERLRQGENPAKDWEGNHLENYDFTDEDYRNGGVTLVADNDGFYTDKMGSSANYEFGINK